MKNAYLPVFLSVLSTIFIASNIVAQEFDFNANVGGMVFVAPDYEGSDDYRTRVLPLIDVTYGDHIFLNTHRGIGWRVAPVNNSWDASIALGYRFGRKESDNKALQGLGEVRGGAELAVFGSYQLAPLNFTLEMRQQLNEKRAGALLELKSSYRLPCPSSLIYSTITPSITWANQDYMSTRFGIDDTQALRSGYPPFHADAGIKDVGVGWSLQYRMTPDIILSTLMTYSRLVGDAAQSPIVHEEGSANQMRGGIGIAYRF